MELRGKKKRGRPKRRFLDVVKEDMGEVGAKETDVEDRTVWRKIIRCGYPDSRERPKGEEEEEKESTKYTVAKAYKRGYTFEFGSDPAGIKLYLALRF